MSALKFLIFKKKVQVAKEKMRQNSEIEATLSPKAFAIKIFSQTATA